MLLSVSKGEQTTRKVCFPKQFFRTEVGEPDRSSTHFPLVDDPASKKNLKHGGFLQRKKAYLPCQFLFPKEIGNEYTYCISIIYPCELH